MPHDLVSFRMMKVDQVDNESCDMEEVVRKVLETVKFNTIY